MNITEDLKSTLNKTLEIALGIEKVSSLINPQKAQTDGKNLVNLIYKDVQTLAIQSRTYTRYSAKRKPKRLTESPASKNEKFKFNLSMDFKKQFSNSIKSINNRVKMSKAGKKSIGQLLRDESMPFNESFSKALSSRVHTPKPVSLPFVSLTTGKTENSMKLPNFEDYLESKGSNYLKMKYNDELIGRFDKASLKVKRFNDEFDIRANSFLKALEEKNKRGPANLKPANVLYSDPKTPRSANNVNIRNFNFASLTPKTRRIKKINFSNTQQNHTLTMQGFNETKLIQNEKFVDMINKIEIERPQILRQKVNLIQNDRERYKNSLYSLKKFARFRHNVENTRRKKQSISYRQGIIYMNIIEEYRGIRYKPSQSELEILEFWKEMVEYGWVVTHADLAEVALIIKRKGINDIRSDNLLKKLSSKITDI